MSAASCGICVKCGCSSCCDVHIVKQHVDVILFSRSGPSSRISASLALRKHIQPEIAPPENTVSETNR